MNTDNINFKSTQQNGSVTQGFIEYAASLYPNKLIKDGKVLIPETLFLLGFHVDTRDKPTNFMSFDNVLVRSKKFPSEVFNTKVYSGRIRKEIKSVIDGKVSYSDKPHFIAKYFLDNEVLTEDSIPEGLLQSIDNIGEKKLYDQGMSELSKPIDPKASVRNIVRK